MTIKIIKPNETHWIDEETKNKTLNLVEQKLVEIRNNFKQCKCELCDKEEIIESHCLPKSILKNISQQGNIRLGQELSGASVKNRRHSISHTLTFFNVCHDCDDDFFSDYEKNNSLDKITDIVLNEIAAKNLLRMIYKRNTDIKVYEYLIENSKNNVDKTTFKNYIKNANMDINDYREELRQIKKNKCDNLYYLIDEKTLNWQTLMAFQGIITLQRGFDAQTIINNTHNYDPKYKIQTLHVCIFPNESATKILLFCKNNSNRLRGFYKRYRKLSLDEQLYCINYMILLESEEWFLKWDFDSKLINDETRNLINTNDNIHSDIPINLTCIDEWLKNEAIPCVEEEWVLKTNGPIFNFLKQTK